MNMRSSGGDRRLSQFFQPDPQSSLNDMEPPMNDWRFQPHEMEERILRADAGHRNLIRQPRIAGSGSSQPAISLGLETLYFG